MEKQLIFSLVMVTLNFVSVIIASIRIEELRAQNEDFMKDAVKMLKETVGEDIKLMTELKQELDGYLEKSYNAVFTEEKPKRKVGRPKKEVK